MLFFFYKWQGFLIWVVGRGTILGSAWKRGTAACNPLGWSLSQPLVAFVQEGVHQSSAEYAGNLGRRLQLSLRVALNSSVRCPVSSLPLWSPWTLSNIRWTQEVLRALPGSPLPASWLENSLEAKSSDNLLFSSFVSHPFRITVLHFLVFSVFLKNFSVVLGRRVNLVPVTPAWPKKSIFNVYVYIHIGALILLLLLQMWLALISCAFKFSFLPQPAKCIFNTRLSNLGYNSLHCCFCKLLGM